MGEAEQDELLITVKQGKLRGKRNISNYSKKEYFSFLGIPYAEPPVGKRRFKTPEPARPWKGILDASKYGNECLHLSIFSDEIVGDEDCLYLNVNTPEAPCKITTPKPVVVYLHIGGFAIGSGSFFGAVDFLIHHDVIYVTFNYRLHVFGFLNLGITECRGNNGLRDAILALKWVQENIRLFGGDPGNVTLFGGSSGAILAHCLMFTKQGEGLFHRAIMQAASACSSITSYHEDPVKLATEYAKLIGCPTDEPKKIYRFLMRKTAKELLVGQIALQPILQLRHLGKYTIMPWAPTVELIKEDAVIPELPRNLSYVNPVPIIYGLCENELVYLRNDIHSNAIKSSLQEIIRKNFWQYDLDGHTLREVTKRVKQKYFDKKQSHHNFDIVCDQFFNEMAVSEVFPTFINVISRELPKSSVYLYLFTFDGKLNLGKKYLVPKMCQTIKGIRGTCHADDSYQLLGGVCSYIPRPGEEEYKMVETMGKLFTNFAKTGNPNDETITDTYWMPNTIEEPCYINLGAKLKMEKGKYFAENMKFWDEIYEFIRNYKLKQLE